jgi:hypothetical protein
VGEHPALRWRSLRDEDGGEVPDLVSVRAPSRSQLQAELGVPVGSPLGAVRLTGAFPAAWAPTRLTGRCPRDRPEASPATVAR